MTVSTEGVLGGFIGCIFFRATFFTLARLTLAFMDRFFDIRLATARFVTFPRADLGSDLRLRTVARFLRCAIIATPFWYSPERFAAFSIG
jgi:hypothetical protein